MLSSVASQGFPALWIKCMIWHMFRFKPNMCVNITFLSVQRKWRRFPGLQASKTRYMGRRWVWQYNTCTTFSCLLTVAWKRTHSTNSLASAWCAPSAITRGVKWANLMRITTRWGWSQGCCTSEGLHHHSRGRSVSLLQQTFTNGAVVTRLPELQPLYCTLRRDFPGTQNSLGLWSSDRSRSQQAALLACLKITRDKLAPGVALGHGWRRAEGVLLQLVQFMECVVVLCTLSLFLWRL